MDATWTTVYGATDDRRIHFMPTDELEIHVEGLQCPCGPALVEWPTGNREIMAIRYALEHKEITDGAEPVPDVQPSGP
jgi:hypothetical protein